MLTPIPSARLSTAALLHDIGKIGISDEILNKAGKLTEEEWEVIRSHPQLGADIVSNVPELASCLAGIFTLAFFLSMDIERIIKILVCIVLGAASISVAAYLQRRQLRKTD